MKQTMFSQCKFWMGLAAVTVLTAVSAAAAPAQQEPTLAPHARIDLELKGANTALTKGDPGTSKLFYTGKWMLKEDSSGILATFDFVGNDWQQHNVTVKVSGGGECIIKLMGPDVRNKAGKVLPLFVDYQKVIVNGKTLYEDEVKPLSASIQKRKDLKLQVKDGEMLYIELICRPAPVILPLDPGMAPHARTDIYLHGVNTALDMANKGTATLVQKGKWMQKPDQSGILATYNFTGKDWQKHQFTAKATGSGNGFVRLLGPDVRKDGRRQQLYVEYQKLSVNGKVLFENKEQPISVWLGKWKNFPFEVKDGDLLKFEIICRPAPLK